MGDIYLVDQTEPSTPTSGCSVMWVDSATKTLKSKDSNGVVHNYGLADTTTLESLNSSESTHLLTGCQTEVNGTNPATFDISAGYLIFSDAHTNPLSPTVYRLYYPGSTGNVNSRLATHDDTLVTIDRTGNIHLHDAMTGKDFSTYRDEVAIGLLFHTDHTQITYTSDGIGFIPRNLGSSVVDFGISVGVINVQNGNVFSGNANMTLAKTAGQMFQLGFNKPNYSNPNIYYNPETNPTLLTYIHCDAGGTYERSALQYNVETKWDNNGTVTALGANEWTVQYIYFAGVFALIQYGQHTYNSMADAMAAINVETLTECPQLNTYTSFRGWMVISGSTTDLTDSLQCHIAQADKFGNRTVTGGLPTNATTMQGAYNNSIEPEVKVTSTRGAVTIQDADTPTGGNLIEIKNSGGTQTILSVAADRIGATEKIRLSGDGICYEDLKIGGLLRAGANPAPTFAQITGLGNVYLYKFGASTLDNLYATVQLPHNWKQGTDIIPHIHWTSEDSNAGNVVWTLEYTWANYNGTFGTTTTVEITAANDTAYKHRLNNFATISGIGKTISSILIIRLSRNGTAAADTYASTAALIDFDIHYEVDSMGSDSSTSKTN